MSPHSNSKQHIMRLLCIEGAFAIAYDTWLGSGYLSGLAGEMGVDVAFVAIISSLPWIGSAGQLLSLGLVSRAPSLKRYTVTMAILGRSLWLIPIIAAAVWGTRAYTHQTPFPARPWFLLVSITAMFVSLIGTSSGIGWSSWMRGLIPGNFQARFFGLRQRYVMFALIVANIIAAALLSLKVGDLQIGYFVMACLAMVAALISNLLLTKIPDTRTTSGGTTPAQEALAKVSVLTPFADPVFRRTLTFAATFNGTIFFCSPYFNYFYTHELSIPLAHVAIWAGLTNLGSFLAATHWARKSDSSRAGPLNTLMICGHAAALAPLVYVLPGANLVPWIAPFEFFINGIAWSGVLIANSTLLFKACPPGRNSVYFSVYSATTGIAGAIGVFLGGQAVQWLEPVGGFRALWVVGTVLRLMALWTLLPPLRDSVLGARGHESTAPAPSQPVQ